MGCQYICKKYIIKKVKNDIYLKKLGKNIAEIRKKRGLSQDRLFVEAEINRHTVYSIESGRSNPQVKTLLKISKALKTPIHELMNVT